MELMDEIGAHLHLRAREQIYPLLGRWRLTEAGIQPATTWPNPESAVGQPTFMYGGVVYRPA
jgi:hypothetical protein